MTDKILAQDWSLYITIPAGAEHEIGGIESFGPPSQSTDETDTTNNDIPGQNAHLVAGRDWSIPVTCSYLETGAGVMDTGQADVVTMAALVGSAAAATWRWTSPGGRSRTCSGTCTIGADGGGGTKDHSKFEFTIYRTGAWA